MAKIKMTVWGWKCERCEKEWIPRDAEKEPRFCPYCKSPYWNKKRQRPKKP
jgi:hypothetical protein